MKLKDAAPWKKSYDQPRQCIKKQRHCFANKGPSSQSYGFSNSHAQIWELDHKEGWRLKNWCFWNMVLEKTLKSALDSKKSKSVNPKENQPWIFIGRTDDKASILQPTDGKSRLIGKILMLEKIESRRRGWQRMWWLDGSMEMSLSKLQEKDREAWHAAVS